MFRLGEISTINDLHNGKIFTYTYDSLSRLKTEVINGSTTSMSVSYDSLGNITSKTMNGNSFIYAYDGNQAHAVSSITYGTQRNFTYDNNGNMTYGWDFTNPSSPKSRQIDYNADNMPETIIYDGSTTTTLLYDGMGTRVKKSVGSTDTYYIGDHFEVRGGGTNVKYIFAGNLRVAQVEGNTRSYFHKDHLGSSTVMTNNSGAELESTEYMPFGSQRNHSGTDTSDYRFTDQELDAENGLYNYGARLYDPFIGRFISPDTIVPQPFNPQSLNRYSYCLNNPLFYTDPSGHAQLTYEQWVAEMESQRADMNIPDYSKFITGFELDDYYMANAPWWWSFDDYGRDAEIEHLYYETLDDAIKAAGGGGYKPSYKLNTEDIERKYGKILVAANINIDDNVITAQKCSDWTFYTLVRTGGDWDYKNLPGLKGNPNIDSGLLEEFGNVHFGIVAAARGFDLSTTLYGAGFYQVYFQSGGNYDDLCIAADLSYRRISNDDAVSRTLSGFTWGDAPGDAHNIMKGWLYYDTNY